jgi:hypothetical protein
MNTTTRNPGLMRGFTDLIEDGLHARVVVRWDRVNACVANKAKAALGATA